MVGGHARTTFFKFKKSKHLDYDPRSKVVCMPHPSHSVSYKILDQVSKNDLKSKFRKINEEKLYKWTYKKDGVHSKNWHEVSS